MRQTRKETWNDADVILAKAKAQGEEIAKLADAIRQLQNNQAITLAFYNDLLAKLGRR